MFPDQRRDTHGHEQAAHKCPAETRHGVLHTVFRLVSGFLITARDGVVEFLQLPRIPNNRENGNIGQLASR